MDHKLLEQFSIINDNLTLFKMQITSLQKNVKMLENNVKKELKVGNKKKDPEIKKKRAPSGFAKPTKVTKELCEFMNLPDGTEIARTEVTKTLVKYIKEHNLVKVNKTSKNIIVPDMKLQNLLNIKEEELNDLDYFNIQKYMNKHFYTKNTKNLEI
jgi:chromatin remodeling complex protein RSC6